VQTARNELVAAGYVVRANSGQFECADPLVPQLWLHRAQQRLYEPGSIAATGSS
jgi:hypothetical protein